MIVAASTWRPSKNEGRSDALPSSAAAGPVPPGGDAPVARDPLPPGTGADPIVPAPGPATSPGSAAGSRPPTAAPPVGPSAGPPAGTPAKPAQPAPPAGRPAQTGGGPRPESETLPPLHTVAPPAGGSGLNGTFRVVDTFPGAFIGEVAVANATGVATNWQVSLQLPNTVTELRASWVDGAPPPDVRRSGQSVVFTSTQPVGAGGVAPLHFQFARTGTQVTPLACTVNTVRCDGTA